MQKTKLILKAKAHGAYNKAKKVYSNAVKTYAGGPLDGSSRHSERLRAEREMLRVYVDFFDALRKSVRAAAQEVPKREENLSSLASLLSRSAPAVGEAQPALQFLLEAVSAMLEGIQEGVHDTSEVLEQLMPTYFDCFLNVGYGEAKTALAQFDRAAKELGDGEARVAALRAQPKPDMSQLGHQEARVQSLIAALDAAEEHAYDTLFRVTSDAEAVLVRALSQYLRSWSQYLAAAAASLEAACEELHASAASELPDLSLPNVGSSSRLPHGPAASAPIVPNRHSLPPATLGEFEIIGSSPPAVAPSPLALHKTAPGPKKQNGAKAKTAGPKGSGPAKAVEVPTPPLLGKSAPPKLSSAPLDGEAALDKLMAKESAPPPQVAGGGFLQHAAPQSLAQEAGARGSVGLRRGSVSLDDAGRRGGGRQRMERAPAAASEVSLDVNDFIGNSYKLLSSAETAVTMPAVETFRVRCGPKRVVQLTVDVENKTLTMVEQQTADAQYTLGELLQFYKATKHFTRLVLRFQGRAKERFDFATMEERERCWELIWAMRGIPLQSTLTLFTTTFNLGETRGPETLEHWLPEGYDVYAVGVQECEYIPHRQHSSVEADLFDGIQRHLGSDYIKVAGQSLLSIRLIVMVRRKYALSCTNVKMRKVPCGHLGKVGNKGAVAIAMHVLNSRFCFVTAHLAAHDDKYAERNMDMQNIIYGLRSLVPSGMSPLNYYHGLFFFGDLNYRVEMPREQVLTYLEQGDATLLLRKDQLKRAMEEGSAFYGFLEGDISFVPTYRVLRGRDGFSDDKMRVPSWTDRVLWRTLPAADVKLGAYSSCAGVLTSDHRPVFAAFQVPLFKPNLPHSSQIRCSITLTALQGTLVAFQQQQQLQMQQVRATSVVVYCANLIDPACAPESATSYNAQWGDSIGPITSLVAANPSYVSARHLMLTVRADRGEVVGTACVPLSPAIGNSHQAFQVFLHDERGLYAGSLSGLLAVKFSKR